MSFRKRNVVLSQHSGPTDAPAGSSHASNLDPSVRPSPLTGHPITSTGCPSLDDLLGGHGGLALGSHMLVEENDTTDFASSLLKFYAAEGLVQGHTLHVVGVGEQWTKSLPGLVAGGSGTARVEQEKMKIAWRYERLGQVDAGRQGPPTSSQVQIRTETQTQDTTAFCHGFDLAKRFVVTPEMKIHHYSVDPTSPDPFNPILQQLSQHISHSDPRPVHRVVLPSLLSPAVYSPLCASPETFLAFLHGLRALLRRFPVPRVTIVSSLPLGLYPRTTGLVRWVELMADCVLELTPFPHLMDASNNVTSDSSAADEQPQGMAKLHKLPLMTEKGSRGRGIGVAVGDDLAFTHSRRRFVIKPFSLPPLDGDTDAQQGTTEAAPGPGTGGSAMPKKADIEF